MPRHYDDSQQQRTTSATPVSTSKHTRRQQEDQRRMEFRRAIESHSEERQLAQTLSDYLEPGDIGEFGSLNVWPAASEGSRRNAQQAG